MLPDLILPTVKPDLKLTNQRKIHHDSELITLVRFTLGKTLKHRPRSQPYLLDRAWSLSLTCYPSPTNDSGKEDQASSSLFTENNWALALSWSFPADSPSAAPKGKQAGNEMITSICTWRREELGGVEKKERVKKSGKRGKLLKGNKNRKWDVFNIEVAYLWAMRWNEEQMKNSAFQIFQCE